MARQLRRPDPDRRPLSLRKVAAALAERGYVASTGKPYEAAAVPSMLGVKAVRSRFKRTLEPLKAPGRHFWFLPSAPASQLLAEGQAVGHTQIAKPTTTPPLHRADSKTSGGRL